MPPDCLIEHVLYIRYAHSELEGKSSYIIGECLVTITMNYKQTVNALYYVRLYETVMRMRTILSW